MGQEVTVAELPLPRTCMPELLQAQRQAAFCLPSPVLRELRNECGVAVRSAILNPVVAEPYLKSLIFLSLKIIIA